MCLLGFSIPCRLCQAPDWLIVNPLAVSLGCGSYGIQANKEINDDSLFNESKTPRYIIFKLCSVKNVKQNGLKLHG